LLLLPDWLAAASEKLQTSNDMLPNTALFWRDFMHGFGAFAGLLRRSKFNLSVSHADTTER